MSGPLKQFEIKPLVDTSLDVGGYTIYFTNSSLFMVLAVFLATLVFFLGIRTESTKPSRFQALVESAYTFIAHLLEENAGSSARPYLPFVFTVFLFILFGNLLGLIPYGFTFTSHIIVTFTLAMIVFLLVTLIGIAHHGLKFFTLFLPQGTPLILIPLVVPIEILSYLSRPVSLSIRLFANMMAGHTMMKVFAMFTISLGVFGFAPLFVNSALIGFELLIAMLQAYVFTLLTCLYLHDSLHLH